MSVQQEPKVGARVCSLIADQLGLEPGTVIGTALLAADLHGDSLDLIELTMAIEEEFGFEIPDEAAEKLLTVADVVAYVERRVLERG